MGIVCLKKKLALAFNGYYLTMPKSFSAIIKAVAGFMVGVLFLLVLWVGLVDNFTTWNVLLHVIERGGVANHSAAGKLISER